MRADVEIKPLSEKDQYMLETYVLWKNRLTSLLDGLGLETERLIHCEPEDLFKVGQYIRNATK